MAFALHKLKFFSDDFFLWNIGEKSRELIDKGISATSPNINIHFDDKRFIYDGQQVSEEEYRKREAELRKEPTQQQYEEKGFERIDTGSDNRVYQKTEYSPTIIDGKIHFPAITRDNLTEALENPHRFGVNTGTSYFAKDGTQVSQEAFKEIMGW